MKVIDDKKIEIKKIVIKMGDKEVTLSIEDAKKLKSVLEELFGKEIIRESFPVPYPYPQPFYPIRPYYWEYQQPTLYCQAGASIGHQNDTVVLNMNCEV